MSIPFNFSFLYSGLFTRKFSARAEGEFPTVSARAESLSGAKKDKSVFVIDFSARAEHILPFHGLVSGKKMGISISIKGLTFISPSSRQAELYVRGLTQPGRGGIFHVIAN